MSATLEPMQELFAAAKYRQSIEDLIKIIIDEVASGSFDDEQNENARENVLVLQYVLDRMAKLEKMERDAKLPPTDLYIKKLEDGEPHFLLMGRDPLAAEAVRFYITLMRKAGVNEEKINIAIHTHNAIEAWPNKKEPS